MRDKKAIVVTGCHRSGTTWVGKMLDLSWRTYYVGEVFRPDSQLLPPDSIPFWYPYISPDSDSLVREAVNRIISLDFSWPDRHGSRRLVPSRLHMLRLTRHWSGLPRPILKDPFISMSVDWLAGEHEVRVLVLVRHPAAVAVSLRRAGWRFDFRNFLQQPQLMEDRLAPYHRQLQNPPEGELEQAALLWACVYHALNTQVHDHPEWILLRYEDLCSDPMSSFSTIYEQLDLAYSKRISSRVAYHSQAGNPVKAPEGELHLIRRDSRSLPDYWRSRLDRTEAKRIRTIAEPAASRYYTDDDW